MIDVVIAYLYGSLDGDIYIKLIERFNFLRHIVLDLGKIIPSN